MAFGNISTLYLPIAANAGPNQWSTLVNKLLDAADATQDVATKTAHGTGGVTVRTVAPYLSSSNDVDESTLGWAVNPTDMNSVAGARRFYPAGDYTLTVDLINNTVTVGATTITMFVYRVSSAAGGRTRTLLGSATSASQNVGSINAITFTVTVPLGQIIFEPDETIQFGFEITAPGFAITGRVTTMRLGTSAGGVQARVDTPTLGTFYTTSLTGVMDGTPTLLRESGKTLDVVLDGTPTLVRDVTGFRVLDAIMDGTPTLVRQVGKPLSVVMNGTVSMVRKIATVLSVVMGGTPSVSKKSVRTLTVVMDGSPTLLRTSTLGRNLSAVMDGSPTLGRALVAARTLSAVMNGLPFGFVKFPWGSLPECPEDWSPNDGLKSIAGDVFFHEPPNQGDPVVGATVTLIRDSDGLLITTKVTDAAGHYSFPRDTNDPYTYHVEVRYTDISGDQQGLSEGGCVPV